MIDELDEPPVNLSALSHDADRRATRVTRGVAQRIARARHGPGVIENLARWAIPLTLAAAASLAVVLFPRNESHSDAFAAFVIPGRPAAEWIITGESPDVAEVVAMVGDTR